MIAIRPRQTATVAAVALMLGGVGIAAATNPAPDTYAFVARGDNPVDALGAAPLAGRLNAPVILTEKDVLTDAAHDVLRDLDPDVVVIAGGPGAVSRDVEDAIEDLLPDADVRRAAGDTRYDTAAELAEMFGELPPSFLGSDGTANHAEMADRASAADTADSATTAESANTANTAISADDAAALGGIPAASVVFGDSVRHTAPIEVVHPSGRMASLETILEATITAPVDGVVMVDGFAIPLDAPLSTSVVMTLDYPDGNLGTDIDDQLELLNGVLDLHEADAVTGLHGSFFAEAGQEYIVRIQGGTVDTTGGAEVESWALNRLSWTFTSRGTGSVTPITEDDIPAARSSGSGLPQLFNRGR